MNGQVKKQNNKKYNQGEIQNTIITSNYFWRLIKFVTNSGIEKSKWPNRNYLAIVCASWNFVHICQLCVQAEISLMFCKLCQSFIEILKKGLAFNWFAIFPPKHPKSACWLNQISVISVSARLFTSHNERQVCSIQETRWSFSEPLPEEEITFLWCFAELDFL